MIFLPTHVLGTAADMKILSVNLVWWCTPSIPKIGRQSQEGLGECEAGLVCTHCAGIYKEALFKQTKQETMKTNPPTHKLASPILVLEDYGLTLRFWECVYSELQTRYPHPVRVHIPKLQGLAPSLLKGCVVSHFTTVRD